jgi:hypothetical protein
VDLLTFMQESYIKYFVFYLNYGYMSQEAAVHKYHFDAITVMKNHFHQHKMQYALNK